MTAADIKVMLDAKRAEREALIGHRDPVSRAHRAELACEIEDLEHDHVVETKREAEEAERAMRAELEKAREEALTPLDVSAWAARIVEMHREVREIAHAIAREIAKRNGAATRAMRAANKLGESPMVFTRSSKLAALEIRQAIGRDVAATGGNLADAAEVTEMLLTPETSASGFKPYPFFITDEHQPAPRRAPDSPRRGYGEVTTPIPNVSYTDNGYPAGLLVPVPIGETVESILAEEAAEAAAAEAAAGAAE